MKPESIKSFVSGIVSIKKFVPLLIICLSCFAGNLLAQDSDLSPADNVVAEHLQKIIDAENKAAHDKAEKEWEHNHPLGGNATGLFFPILIVSIVIGFSIYAKNKAAGKAFAAFSLTVIMVIVVFSLIDDYETLHNVTPVKNTGEVLTQLESERTGETDIDKIVKLKEIDASVIQIKTNVESLKSVTQRVKYVQKQVTFFWQQYQTDLAIPAKPDDVGGMEKYYRDNDALKLYNDWLADFQKESGDMTQQQQYILEQESNVQEMIEFAKTNYK